GERRARPCLDWAGAPVAPRARGGVPVLGAGGTAGARRRPHRPWV
ncbi:MAG: hypothetical protein AVDCRST_MAG88-3496, partial [uncultured Thermomicrobiales bacterium]